MLTMTTDQIRSKYIKFFESRGHKAISPAPLVLADDPTTLFTSSGMQPLVPYLLGQPHPEGNRLVDSQPAIRLQDIEEVGNNRHTTYFEMLGNWSLGDYFKREQLPWVWEFFTKELELPKDKLWVSVFEGNKEVPRDEEAADIWKKIGVPESRIFYYDAKENWWSRSGPPESMPPGEIGGPDSEVFYEFTDIKHDSKFGKVCTPSCDCGHFLEIGNSVFMQYKKRQDGKLEELSQKSVDFGGGLERLVMATENLSDIYKTHIFKSLVNKVEKVSGRKYSEDDNVTKKIRIISEHIRASEALIKADVEPSNKAQGYILRRLIRRSAVSMRNLKDKLDKTDLSFSEDNNINEIIQKELEKFMGTLDKGLREVNKINKIDGKKAFDLYQTYGFPLEITEEIFEEKGQKINHEQFEREFNKHRESSRTASAGKFKGGLADHSEETTRLHTATHLLHQALREVLGNHVSQKGSNITHERLRFDFTHTEKLSEDEIKKVEDLINKQIDKNLKITTATMTLKEAKAAGALAFFGDKYDEKVSVYSIGDYSAEPAEVFSKEVCGGPHVSSLSELGGRVKITKQDSASAGVRRIYAQIESAQTANE
jgi:alanyl-tRNA synthetase